MAFNWDLLVPYQYQTQTLTLRQLERIMLRTYNREYVRRFIGWLHYKNGHVGAGGLSRTDQPNLPGFAPTLLQSFHWAGQQYADGTTGACAVDTVTVDGPDAGNNHDGIPWSEVPIQGTAEAVTWGLHANVGTVGNGESWHIQPIEIDGHASWVRAGRPAPRVGYPIPVEHDPYYVAPEQPQPEPNPTPTPIPGDEDMSTKTILHDTRNDGVYLCDVNTKVWIDNGNVSAQLAYRVMEAMGLTPDYTKPPQPWPAALRLSPHVAIDGHRYSVVTNGNPHVIASFGPIIGARPAGVDEYGR